MKHMAIVGLALILLQGCGGNSINLRAARNYAAAGYQAMHAGDWKNAQTYFSRAILNAQLAKAGPRAMAVLKYEYGRSSGVICDWGEAQAGLNEAYDLDRQNAGPAYMSLYELARLNLDRRDYPKAKEYFEQAFAEFQKIGADTSDPLAYAEFLEEYAVTLENTWSGTEAFAHRERALEIRGTFPAGKSHTEKTPYGAQCAPASGDAGDADRPAKEIGFSRRRNSPEAACIRGNSPSFLKHLFLLTDGEAQVEIMEIDGLASMSILGNRWDKYCVAPGKHSLGVGAYHNYRTARNEVELEFEAGKDYWLRAKLSGGIFVLQFIDVSGRENKNLAEFNWKAGPPTPVEDILTPAIILLR